MIRNSHKCKGLPQICAFLSVALAAHLQKPRGVARQQCRLLALNELTHLLITDLDLIGAKLKRFYQSSGIPFAARMSSSIQPGQPELKLRYEFCCIWLAGLEVHFPAHQPGGV